MTDISDRIASRMRELNIKQVDLIDKYGFSKGTVSKWVSGVNTPNGINLTKLASILKVSESWIVSGTESPLYPMDEKGQFKMANIEFRKPDNTKPLVKIPVYRDVKASCGDGIENFLENVSDYMEIDPNILKMFGIQAKPENLKIIYSEDYSMSPTVSPDSPLFVDVGDKDPSAIKNGDVYVFTHNYHLRMKRIFISYGDNKTVRLVSDNPDKNKFPDEYISREQLNEINFVGRLESAVVKF